MVKQGDPRLQGVSIHTAFQLARRLWRQASGCKAGFGAPLPSADCVGSLHSEVVAAASLQALQSELRGAAVIHLLKVLALITALQPAEHAHKESVAGLLAWMFGMQMWADVKLQKTANARWASVAAPRLSLMSRLRHKVASTTAAHCLMLNYT